VNLIGFLSGGLGLGNSVRLLDEALTAANIPVSTYPVTRGIGSRTDIPYRHTAEVKYDISLIAVNETHAKMVVESMADVVDNSYRIGTWY